MENRELNFLSKVTDILSKDVDMNALNSGLKSVLAEITAVKSLNLFVIDSITNTFRNCTEDWCIEENEVLDKVMSDIQNNDFVINTKAYKLPSVISDITLKINSLFMPIVKNEKVVGLIEVDFEEDTAVNMQFLF